MIFRIPIGIAAALSLALLISGCNLRQEYGCRKKLEFAEYQYEGYRNGTVSYQEADLAIKIAIMCQLYY